MPIDGLKKIGLDETISKVDLDDFEEEVEEDEIEDFKEEIKFFEEKYLFFSPEDKECKYEARNDKSNKNSYNGQLKLFLELLSFILYYKDEMIEKVVYVGAMEGTNIAYIAKLFPSLQFDLYDKEQKGRKFDEELKKLKNVTIYNTYFEDKHIEKYLKENKNESKIFPHKTNIMFVSDIRSIEVGSILGFNNESIIHEQEVVWSDMLLQQTWVEKLYPKISSLKFRLPYVLNQNEILKKYYMDRGGLFRRYLDGKVMRQVFHKYTSAESRLIVDSLNYRDWNISTYERKNAYHNYYFRRSKFYNIFTNDLTNYDEDERYNHKHNFDTETSDCSYDSTVLVFLIKKYFESININIKSSEVCMKFINKLLLFLNKNKKIRIGRK
jgi:hypothetical protein